MNGTASKLRVQGCGCPRQPRGGRPRAGFTLIEVLVVLAVIATLAALVAPDVLKHVSTARDQSARAQIEMLASALDAYRLDNGAYPTTEQGLDALRRQPTLAPLPKNWRGPYLRKAVPGDPWDRPYKYENPGSVNTWGFDLQSLGADGQVGGTGENADITSW